MTDGTSMRMVVRIAGKRMYLWRPVDHEGEILDVLVQRQRDTCAAVELIRKPLRKQGFTPRLVVTDKLRSYAAARRCCSRGSWASLTLTGRSR